MPPRTGRHRGKDRYACRDCIKGVEVELEELKLQNIKKIRGITDSKI